MICPNCGHSNKDGTKNCKNCGYLLVKKSPLKINYVILTLAIIIAILSGELAYVFGGMYHTKKENMKVHPNNDIKVAIVNDNLTKNSLINLNDLTFISIPKSIYQEDMLTIDTFKENNCATTNLIKDSILFKDMLSVCSENNNNEEKEDSLKELTIPNKVYGFKKNNYVDLYLKTINNEKLVFAKLYTHLLVKEANANTITLIIPEEYSCLFNNVLKLNDTEFVITNSKTEVEGLTNNELKELIESKTKDMGCDLNEE